MVGMKIEDEIFDNLRQSWNMYMEAMILKMIGQKAFEGSLTLKTNVVIQGGMDGSGRYMLSPSINFDVGINIPTKVTEKIPGPEGLRIIKRGDDVVVGSDKQLSMWEGDMDADTD